MIGIKTYNDIYLETRKALKAAGIEAYDLEARLMLSAAAGKSREEFYRDIKFYAMGETEARVREFTARRIAGEPIAYVLGEWEFMGLPMEVAAGVLIPRPETETLAELALRLLRGRHTAGARVLDLCCGTGCIGISVAAKVADAKIVLADNSMKALRVARKNVRRNNVAGNTIVIDADVLKSPPMMLGRFDMIISNPPYIPTKEIKTLDSSVRDFEPREALDGGPDGLDFYRAIIPRWTDILKDDGVILFECGEGQADEIGLLLRDSGFTAAYHEDAFGVRRIVAGLKENKQP